MLYLVATPIGNLGDITFRAVDILKNCDYILCEDTRHSLPLLKRYDIHKPLKSLHKFNEAAREEEVLSDLEAGRTIGLISDAGTPGISDPGSKLAQSCLRRDFPVQAIPGPCAAITALTVSGLDTHRFQFVGFLPRKKGELISLLQELLSYSGTTICYESPHRLKATLKEIEQLAPLRPLVIARELTKKFEEFMRGTAQELVLRLENSLLKGEITLLISEDKYPPPVDWSQQTPEEHVQQLIVEQSLTKQEAIKTVAKLRGVPKRIVYNAVMR